MEMLVAVCEACYTGNHKHMNPGIVNMIKEDMDLGLFGGIDCKNDCLCPEMLMLKQEIILKKAEVK
jgi:hypothetical protein